MDGLIKRVRRNVNYGYGIIQPAGQENQEYFFVFPLSQDFSVGDEVDFVPTVNGVSAQIPLAIEVNKKVG